MILFHVVLLEADTEGVYLGISPSELSRETGSVESEKLRNINFLIVFHNLYFIFLISHH